MRASGRPAWLLDARLLLGAELLVEPGEARGERGDGVVVALAHHHAHGEVAERDRRAWCRAGGSAS